MIDIIIPAYNAHNTIEETIFSIICQSINYKLNVYIVDDGSLNNYNEIVSFFSDYINIIELTIENNMGPGVARQFGISNSSSDYIIFIDSDDIFYDSFSVEKMYNAINNSDIHLVVSSFLEEVDDGFVNHDMDTIWLHGKIYKRSFLDDNNIRFNNSRANEDNGFNQLILLHDVNVKFIKDVTYVWKNNLRSITRINDYEYKLRGLQGYVYNIKWALDEAIKSNCSFVKIAELSFSSVVAMYYYFLEFGDYNLIKMTKVLKEISDKYKLGDKLCDAIIESQLSFQCNDNNRDKLVNSNISFKDFLGFVDDA